MMYVEEGIEIARHSVAAFLTDHPDRGMFLDDLMT
jgi:hypothetical protein